ncbi:tetratricopeptide TPR_2 repeat protein [[Leptolyngbya] sp. PCC 7376]|uniref:CHAT domain-containing protein n=1 Tax=[Leptolyngbya] sp. PCC 7376 TaxID=111781 RepID=UPI00029F1A0E|nr:CHAT domain-containing protein [[Leptolyngbya] sp. PCC 7376]AFY39739.1 tetratricopeptide TPR_2 repeat protein [[Leptolyngbya] sp. PCC 7376]
MAKFKPHFFFPKPWQRLAALGLMSCFLVCLPSVQAFTPENTAGDKTATPTILLSEQTTGLTKLQAGQQYYQAGQYQAALEVWQEAESLFQVASESQSQALVNNYLALANQRLGGLEEAAAAIATAESLAEPYGQQNPNLLGVILNTKGRVFLAQGKAMEAVEAWQGAQKFYRQSGDRQGTIGAQLNEMQALQVLGYFRQANRLTGKVKADLAKQPDDQLKAIALQNFGDLLQVMGTLDEAETQLNAAQELANTLNNDLLQSRIANSLGNIARQRSTPEAITQAAQYYQQAIAESPTKELRVDSSLNYLSLLSENFATEQMLEGTDQTLLALIPNLKADLAQASLSRQGIETQINWATQLLKLQSLAIEHQELQAIASLKELQSDYIASTLVKATQQAQQLRDVRTESFAKGILGSMYEQNQQWEEAQTLTNEALALATQAQAGDIAYRWQWQLGRIALQFSDRQKGIDAYQASIDTLNKVRGDLLATNAEFQFSFRDSVEPVYRELVSLLIRPDSTPAELQQARAAIEDLQLAELEDFFRSACIDLPERSIEDIDSTATVLYPIILGDRLVTISSIPGKPLQHHTVNIGKDEVEATLEEFLQSLNPAFDDKYRLGLSKTVYEWLIQPIEQDLDKTETLVFVLDGFLRSIPMAALHDGDQYLVEKYNLALAPGLQLVDPSTINRDTAAVLALGLSQSRQNFPPLPGVKAELAAIDQAIPSQIVLDESFTESNLRKEILADPFPILHLATHGQFSSNSDETFLLSWDGLIEVEEFKNIIDERSFIPEQPIELLILSACETAAGDKQAALGLAGFAVQSGARSTLATLWSVSDISTTTLMTEFYAKFTAEDNLSRSESLRQAQLSLLNSEEYSHPFFWAPFVMVGSWL